MTRTLLNTLWSLALAPFFAAAQPSELAVFAPDAALTCARPMAVLTAGANFPDAIFWWKTPDGDSLSGKILPAVEPGEYHVFAQDPRTGATASHCAQVSDRRIFPKLTVLGGEITCREPQTTLCLAACPRALHFEWHGPDGFRETSPIPTVGAPGVYAVTATELSSGCTAVGTAEVADKRAMPTAQASLKHSVGKGTWLSAEGSSAGREFVYYWWSEGSAEVLPADSSSGQIWQPGEYNLLVVNTLNGCSASQRITASEAGGLGWAQPRALFSEEGSPLMAAAPRSVSPAENPFEIALRRWSLARPVAQVAAPALTYRCAASRD